LTVNISTNAISAPGGPTRTGHHHPTKWFDQWLDGRTIFSQPIAIFPSRGNLGQKVEPHISSNILPFHVTVALERKYNVPCSLVDVRRPGRVRTLRRVVQLPFSLLSDPFSCQVQIMRHPHWDVAFSPRLPR
jgi:hypothetical protein